MNELALLKSSPARQLCVWFIYTVSVHAAQHTCNDGVLASPQKGALAGTHFTDFTVPVVVVGHRVSQQVGLGQLANVVCLIGGQKAAPLGGLMRCRGGVLEVLLLSCCEHRHATDAHVLWSAVVVCCTHQKDARVPVEGYGSAMGGAVVWRAR